MGKTGACVYILIILKSRGCSDIREVDGWTDFGSIPDPFSCSKDDFPEVRVRRLSYSEDTGWLITHCSLEGRREHAPRYHMSY